MKTAIQKPIYRLCVCAMLIALSTVLSEIKIPKAFGGSVTLFSMVPVCLIGILYGLRWGLPSCCLYGGIQLLLGLKNLSYATGWHAVLAIIFLDYLLAFSGLCLSGVFCRKVKNQSVACGIGVALGCVLRFVCHFITGVTVWRDASASFAASAVFSLTYNATYMLPELVLTTVGVVLLVQTGAVRQMKKMMQKNG